MKKDYSRIWYACMLFGAALAALSFAISLNPNDSYFFYIGLFFIGINIIGFLKIRKYYSKPCNNKNGE